MAKFAASYETVRALARGAVETFEARHRASGERVLSHIFECAEPPLDQPTAQWILTSFSNIAGEPAGIVIDIGRYDIGTLAYIVTRWPGAEAVQNWLARYENGLPVPGPNGLSPDQTNADTSVQGGCSGGPVGREAFSEEGVPEQPGNNPGFTDVESAPEQGGFTRQFSSEIGTSVDQAQAPSPANAPRSLHREPAVALPGSEVDREAPDSFLRERASSAYNEPAPSTDSGQFTKVFINEGGSNPSGAQRRTEEVGEPPMVTEEFTKVFRSAGSVEESGYIVAKPDSSAGRSSGMGEFTRIFGTNEAASVPSVHTRDADESATEGPDRGSITDILNHRSADRRESSENVEVTTHELPREEGLEALPPRDYTEPKYSPGQDIFHEVPSETFSASDYKVQQGALGSTERADATIMFSRPVDPAGADEASLPAGPSEYTRFMRKEDLPTAGAQPAASAPPPGKPGGAGAAPAMPGFPLPQVTPPAPPSFNLAMPPPPAASVAIPGGPSISAPPMPLIPAPPLAVPPAPAAGDQQAKSAFSYWPLLLILNVLFILAVALVVYFLLKR